MKTDNKALFKMSWPIFVELLLQLLVGNMDQVQLSHFNNTAVAAVGNVNTIMNVVLLLFNVTTLAAMILISQYRGANDTNSVNQLYSLSVLANLVLSIGLAAALFFGANGLLGIMQVPAELLGEARSYLRITALVLPFQAMMLTFSSFMRANARMKDIMVITAVINAFNIAGNWALINGVGFLPRMGAGGAALSSGICRAGGMVLMLVAFLRTCPGAHISLQYLRPWPKNLFRRLLALGLPSAGESLSYNLSQASCLVFVNLMGTYVVTTRMYANIFAYCIYMLIVSVSQAMQIMVGHLIGAGKLQEAGSCAWRVFRLFTPITVGIAALVAVFAKPLFSFFSNDPRVIALGQTIAVIEIVLEVGRCSNICLIRALQAAGDVKFPVVVGIVSQWVLGVGLCYVLGVIMGWGLAGIWIAFACDECLRGLIFVIRWRQGKWKRFKTV